MVHGQEGEGPTEDLVEAVRQVMQRGHVGRFWTLSIATGAPGACNVLG